MDRSIDVSWTAKDGGGTSIHVDVIVMCFGYSNISCKEGITEYNCVIYIEVRETCAIGDDIRIRVDAMVICFGYPNIEYKERIKE